MVLAVDGVADLDALCGPFILHMLSASSHL